MVFPYDSQLLAAVSVPPTSIDDVLRIMRTIESICADGDGLKWFNGLYLQVTEAVEAKVAANAIGEPAWLASLDVEFAKLYFQALQQALSGQTPVGCWRALFDRRTQVATARIQFALAGVNAHINHDLPQALVNTCRLTGTNPQHGTAQYNSYTTLNATLDSLIEEAKRTLRVGLLGNVLPPVAGFENTIAAWNVSAAREAAWNNAEILWHLQAAPALASAFMDTLDGLTTVASKALLVPIV